MPRTVYVDFQEAKQRITIEDVLRTEGLLSQFHRKGDSWVGACPFHAHNPIRPNTRQFRIDQKEGVSVWHCFGDCQEGGDVVSFVAKLKQLDYEHARLYFAEHYRDRLGNSRPPGRRSQKERARETHHANENVPQALAETSSSLTTEEESLKPLNFYLNLDPKVAYLTKRGVKAETIARFGIGMARKGYFKGYVAIPIHRWPKQSADENPIGYVGRWPGEDCHEENGPLRYKLPENFPRNRVVYGLGEALDGSQADDPLIVVEGPFKVFHLCQAGFPNVAATLGAHVSDEQVRLLLATGRKIVLMLDGDEAGRKGTIAAAGKLMTRVFTRVVKIPDGKAPDDFSEDEIKRILSPVMD